METNIVEVENFVQQTEERRVSAFAKEVKRYLETYPDTQYVDVLLTDLNGCFRGKRIPVAGLSKLEKGCYFPGLGVCDGYSRQCGGRGRSGP